MHNNARRLTDKEQRDCDVIGTFKIYHTGLPVKLIIFVNVNRASDQVVLLHCAQVDPGFGA